MTVFNYLLNYYQDPAIQVFRSAEIETQFLLFNLDANDGANPQQSLSVRKVISQCINRERLVQILSNNLFKVPQIIDFDLPDHPAITLDFMNYTPDTAKTNLETIGWVDHDSNPKTPRISQSINGMPDGNELGFTLIIEAGSETENAGNLIRSMLEECGLAINLEIKPREVMWNPTEESSLFQGDYDFAILAWTSPIKNPCLLFAGDQIPDLSKNILGSNFSRFSHPRVNELCAEFSFQITTEKYQQIMVELQKIINTELPVIPIYSYSSLLTAQKDFCWDGMDETNTNELAGIEEFRINTECP